MKAYCDYNNAEWVKRFDGLKNPYYKTKIEGNTIYIISRDTKRALVYKKIIGNLYRLTGEVEEKNVCHFGMCKMHERILIEILDSFGFEVDSGK